jgi:hypothetical protein
VFKPQDHKEEKQKPPLLMVNMRSLLYIHIEVPIWRTHRSLELNVKGKFRKVSSKNTSLQVNTR